MFITFTDLTARLIAIISKNFCNDDGFGHNYEEYKGMGQAAVNHLLETKEGQVKAAFFSYKLRDITGIGEIDIAWGKVLDSEKHTGYGIAHILDKHGIAAVKMIGEIIEKGSFNGASNGKIKIKYKKYNVIISPEWKGSKRNIIVSGFDKEKTSSKKNKRN